VGPTLEIDRGQKQWKRFIWTCILFWHCFKIIVIFVFQPATYLHRKYSKWLSSIYASLLILKFKFIRFLFLGDHLKTIVYSTTIASVEYFVHVYNKLASRFDTSEIFERLRNFLIRRLQACIIYIYIYERYIDIHSFRISALNIVFLWTQSFIIKLLKL